MKKIKATDRSSIEKKIQTLKSFRNVEGVPDAARDDADQQIKKLEQQLENMGADDKTASSKKTAASRKRHRQPFFKVGDVIKRGKKQITVESIGEWDDEEKAYRMLGSNGFTGHDKELKKLMKKSSGKSDDEVSASLKDCKEMIAANRKPRKEPIHHTRETRLRGALNTIVNICLEGNESDPATIEKIKTAVTQFEIKLKRDFLGLKIVKPSKEIKDKLDDAKQAASA